MYNIYNFMLRLEVGRKTDDVRKLLRLANCGSYMWNRQDVPSLLASSSTGSAGGSSFENALIRAVSVFLSKFARIAKMFSQDFRHF